MTDEKVKCFDCKIDFPIMETYFNWNTGARRCWTCQVSYLKQQCQKRDELIKAQDELIKYLDGRSGYCGYLMSATSVNLRDKIEQLKKEIQ